MEKYYTPELKTLPDGTLEERVICFGEFEDSDEAYDAADEKNYYTIWSEDCLEGTNKIFAETIEKFNLADGKHRYFGEDESGQFHLIGTMESIAEADEATDAMEEYIVNIYSSERILRLNRQIGDILAAQA